MDKIANKPGDDLLQRFLELLAEAQALPPSEAGQWALLQSYAEVQFVLQGGRRCPVCNAHVRHVLPIIAEHKDGTTVEFPCLCTRCFEAERAVSRVMITHLGKIRIEHFPIAYGRKTLDWRAGKDRAKAAKKETSE